MVIYWLTVVVLAVGTCYATHYTECASTVGVMESLDIDGCPESPCYLTEGREKLVRFTFIPSQSTKHLMPEATIEIANLIIVNATVMPIDACESVDRDCPLNDGEIVVYEANLKVPRRIPAAGGMLHWKLLDDSRDVVCFDAAIIVREPSDQHNSSRSNKKIKK